jgi:5-methyltetrahydrofolate--homocysteine methyltransferase
MLIIGEKINASIPAVKAIYQQRDRDGLIELAGRQARAGADQIDVNVGTGLGSREDEIAAMVWAIENIQQELEIPICIDSPDPAVIEAGLRAREGRSSLINSTKAEDESLKKIVPLALRYEAPLVALAMDESGIPETLEGRIDACRKTVAVCLRSGLALESIYFDPLVIPVSTDVKQGIVTLNCISAIKRIFPGAKTVTGLSNISYGLPSRSLLNVGFLYMAMNAGLDAVIMDPLVDEQMSAVRAGEVLIGKDRHCRRYTRAFRLRSQEAERKGETNG